MGREAVREQANTVFFPPEIEHNHPKSFGQSKSMHRRVIEMSQTRETGTKSNAMLGANRSRVTPVLIFPIPEPVSCAKVYLKKKKNVNERRGLVASGITAKTVRTWKQLTGIFGIKANFATKFEVVNAEKLQVNRTRKQRKILTSKTQGWTVKTCQLKNKKKAGTVPIQKRQARPSHRARNRREPKQRITKNRHRTEARLKDYDVIKSWS